MKRIYIAADADPLECSMCDQKRDMLVRVPIKSWAKTEEEPWFGLCETCVLSLYFGFKQARAKAQNSEGP